MRKEIKAINNTRSSVLYHFDAEEFSTEKNKVVAEYCTSVAVPGFRKGKAPKGLILSKFGNDIDSRARSVLINKSLEDAEKSKQELHLLVVTDFSVDKEEDGIAVKLIYDLQPDIKLPDYKSIKLDPFSSDVSEKEIEDEFVRIKKQHSRYIPVDREVKPGDYVKVNYEGILRGGSKIADVVSDHKIWGKQTGTWEEAGNKDVPGVQAVIQGVIGHKVGDKGSGKETFPKDFSVPELAGKKATYDFEVLDVRERVDPELNEEFFKQYGVTNATELKNRIRESIAQHKTTQGLVKQRDQIMKFLANAADFELPESVLKREIQSLAQMFVDSQVRGGASVKTIEGHIGEISENLTPLAGERGKSGMMLDKIAEVEKIAIDNKDVEAMIWQDCMLKKLNVNQYVNSLQKDRNLLIDLRSRTLHGKVLDFLVKLNSQEAADTTKISKKKSEKAGK
ncbi:MAG: trigger factor [Opitutales bacterium]|nr:trigger factor [Opitutales bacterium]